MPEPTYGTQLQDFGLAGHPTEYRLSITYEEIEVPLSGGEMATLRTPTYEAADLGYGPLHPEAGLPTVRHQSASAFAGDIGISSPLVPAAWGKCTEAQDTCRSAPHGDQDHRGFEMGDEGLDLVTFYSRNLGVPARRDVDDPQVLRGKEVFYTTGYVACHQPAFVTHRLVDQPEQSFQLIWPYKDMLLHDIGPGLADNRPEARRSERFLRHVILSLEATRDLTTQRTGADFCPWRTFG